MDQYHLSTENTAGIEMWKERGHATLFTDRQITAPFIGRQQELALLHGYIGAAANGHARLVFVTGETGIGKTRLLEEAARHAATNGALVLAQRRSSGLL